MTKNETPPDPARKIKTMALLACLAAVATMFFGAIAAGVMATQMDKVSPGVFRSDEP